MLRARVLVVAAVLMPLTVSTFARQPSLEYDVKAAFVLNFVRYVEWPSARRTPPLRICVLQVNPFGSRLEAVVSGEQWQGGGIDVRVVPDMRRAAECHLLYVPAAAAERFTSGISLLAGQGVLTVGEDERFLEQGGMIHLFVEDNRVRFSINQKAADSADVLISSRLLRLARNVIGTAEAP
jgi:hypothetical protein